MVVTLIDLEEAKARLTAGELAYEFMTSNPQFRLLGPACGFGITLLQRYRSEGLYAENLEEANEMAHSKQATITGVWFVKREPHKPSTDESSKAR